MFKNTYRTHRSFIKGTIVLTLTGLLSRVIGFFYRIYLSRMFGEEGMGIYQLLSPVLALSFSLCAAGIQTAISKYVAESTAKSSPVNGLRYLLTGLFFSITISLLCMLTLISFSDYIALHFLLEERTASMLRIIALSIPAGAIHSCINGYYYGIKKTALPSATQLVEQFFRVLCVFSADLFARRTGTVPTINAAVVGLVIGECAAMVISIAAVYLHFQKLHSRSRLKSGSLDVSYMLAAGKLLSLSLPLSISRIVVNLLQSVEAVAIPSKLSLYGYDTASALSVYGVLTGMAMPLLFFPNALTGSMSVLLLPIVSEADAGGNKRAVRRTTLKTIYSSLFLGVVCTIFFFFAGPFLGDFLFKSFLAGKFIRLLSMLCPFLYLCTTLSGILHGLGKAFSVFFVNVFSLSLRLLFVFFLIPVFGIECYILSMILSQLFSALLYLLLLRDRILSDS